MDDDDDSESDDCYTSSSALQMGNQKLINCLATVVVTCLKVLSTKILPEVRCPRNSKK